MVAIKQTVFYKKKNKEKCNPLFLDWHFSLFLYKGKEKDGIKKVFYIKINKEK